MVSAEVLRDLNSLQPDEQTLVLSLVKSLNRNAVKKTEAQIQFEKECRKYEGKNMTMQEIDQIIHDEE